MAQRKSTDVKVARKTPRAAAPRARKPRGAGHERRAEIIAAAKLLFIAEGYATVTTRKLAEKVGLSQTGLYVYFRNKDEIHDAICRGTFEKLLQRFQKLETDIGVVPDLARRMLGTYVEFGLAHPDEYQLTFMTPHTHGGEKKSFDLPVEEQPLAMQAFLCLAGQIEKLQKAGYLKPGNPVTTAQTFWATAHGLVSLLITMPDFTWTKRDVLVATMTDYLFEGALTDKGRRRNTAPS